jgi:RNA polymerase sigma-70 factor, ECF subfamily
MRMSGGSDRVARREAAALDLMAHLPRVYGYIRRRIEPREEAEDVTAEVFAAALEGLSHLQDPCKLEAWLLGIARHKVAGAARRQAASRRGLETWVEEIEPPAAMFARLEGEQERRRAVRSMMERLAPDYREVLLLKYAEQCSIEEIAAIMKRSVPSVKGILRRAKETARRYFLDGETDHEAS